jgi:lipopolysaccharide export LptBFGC system permease protein LptF
MLTGIVARMSKLAPPRHRELVRGMLAELDSIPDPVERTRFAMGALTAIARLTLRGEGRFVEIGEPEGGSNPGGRPMSTITARQLLVRHVVPFIVSLVSLTVLLQAQRWERVSEFPEQGADGALFELILLALPSTLALTIPMAVFLAVSWVFTRLGTEGVLTAARGTRGGVRRLMTPVLGAAAVVATFAVVSNTEILPRANERFVEVFTGAPSRLADRTMTIGELRAAAESVRPTNAARAAAYDVEIHKKFAISFACVIMALIAAALALRFPRAGRKLVLAGSSMIFLGYYLLMIGGEQLADRMLLSPVLAMWLADALLAVFAVALLRAGPSSSSDPTQGAEALAIDG